MESLFFSPILPPEPNNGLPVVLMTPEILSLIIGVILHLSVTYVPGFKKLWDSVEDYKRSIIALAGLILSFAIAAMGYSEIIITDLPTPFFWAGVWRVVFTWLAFVGIAQVGYALNKDWMNGNDTH